MNQKRHAKDPIKFIKYFEVNNYSSRNKWTSVSPPKRKKRSLQHPSIAGTISEHQCSWDPLAKGPRAWVGADSKGVVMYPNTK